MGASTHSAHSVDLLSCCIEHGSVDTAWTAVHATHRNNTDCHFPGTSCFLVSLKLSSVSVFLLPFPSGNFWATSRFLFFDPSSRLSSRFLAAQNKSNRFYVKPNFSACRQLSRIPHSGGYCAAILLSFCLRPLRALSPQSDGIALLPWV